MSSVQPTLSRSSDEEDISHAGGWIEESESPSEVSRSGSKHDKGKRKESDEETLQDHTQETEDGGPEDSGELYTGVDEYPPTTEEVEESRRVEENLRKWEIAERERRKAARESNASGGSSIVTGIARRASLLWPGSHAKRAASGGVGTHRKLRTTDSDAVPLEDMEASPGPSRVVTPEPADNPFATPSQSTLNLALSQQSAIMTASASRSPFEDGEQSPETPKAATANAHHPSASLPKPTPPQPLNLPEPRSPPPRTETPHASRPPEPIAPPTLTPTQQAEEPPEVRWWTEWCCGCSEGPDRGGDHQAGRTNPSE